ncbi:hypothetical protein DXA96_02140 [Lachnospiraceae bacterium OF09-33XD]|nr:hypothetical protein DXA96_02140 [Lachnospiraceae bacterium OF09-33XD]
MEFIDDLQMQLAENLSEEIHCHSCYEIIWAVCGEGIYRDEADYFPFPENRILVVNPFKNHAVLMEKGSAAIQLYLPGRFFLKNCKKSCRLSAVYLKMNRQKARNILIISASI